MKCPACQAEVASGSSFCPRCGGKLADGGDLATSTPVAAGGPMAGFGRRPIADTPEVTLWEGGFSPKAMLGPFIGCALFTLLALAGGLVFAQWIVAGGIILVIWLLFALQFVANRLRIHYTLTNHMFYHRRGVLTRTIDRVEVIAIDDVEWSQSLLEQLTGTGTVTIFAPLDRTSKEGKLPIVGIDNVEQVAKLIDKARRDERVRRGFLTVEETNVGSPSS